ncbi:BamA/TamA family outer membrane protein [Cyanobacterium stanieri]|nr:BamA/TamA family outer membrane protein [Cyanobacterium stanieri]
MSKKKLNYNSVVQKKNIVPKADNMTLLFKVTNNNGHGVSIHKTSMANLVTKFPILSALLFLTTFMVSQPLSANAEVEKEDNSSPTTNLQFNLSSVAHQPPNFLPQNVEINQAPTPEDFVTESNQPLETFTEGINKPQEISPNLEIALKDKSNQEISPNLEIAVEDKSNQEIISPNLEINIDSQSSSPQQILLAQNNPSSSQEEARVLVAEVVVEGVEGELEDLVYNVIRTAPGRTTSRSQLQEDINAIFATGFFSDANVVPSDTPLGVRITYTVAPNPVLQRVQLQTVSGTSPEAQVPPEVVDELFGEQYGSIINLRDLQEGISGINTWYSDNGFDLAQVVSSPQVSPDGVVTLIIAEGEIEDIQVKYFNEDNEEVDGKTREFIITREVELKPGDIFNRNTAQRDLQRVFGLGIFQDVRLSFSEAEDPSKVVMNIEVVQGNTGSIAAGAGISSNSGFFGTLSYQEQNLGGNNQNLGAEFQLGERELLFDLSLRDPWIATTPDRTSYIANIFRRRSISLVFDGTDTESIRTEVGDTRPRVVRTGTGITFSRPLAEDPFTRPEWTLSAGLQYQRVEIKNTDGDLSPRSSAEFGNELLSISESGQDDLFLVRFNAARDRRNNRLQPTEGSFFLVGMEQTVPLGSGNILFNRIRANYSHYIPVNFLDFDFAEGPQALAFNVQAGTVLGDLPPYEAFVLGGSNSVRGYGEGDLGNGRTFIQASAEYRFPIFSIVGGALFLDFGSDLGSGSSVPGQPAEVRGLNGTGYGYGLGVRIQSPVGPIRIDYGVNDEGDNRIHFGIGERF